MVFLQFGSQRFALMCTGTGWPAHERQWICIESGRPCFWHFWVTAALVCRVSPTSNVLFRSARPPATLQLRATKLCKQGKSVILCSEAYNGTKGTLFWDGKCDPSRIAFATHLRLSERQTCVKSVGENLLQERILQRSERLGSQSLHSFCKQPAPLFYQRLFALVWHASWGWWLDVSEKVFCLAVCLIL